MLCEFKEIMLWNFCYYGDVDKSYIQIKFCTCISRARVSPISLCQCICMCKKEKTHPVLFPGLCFSTKVIKKIAV